jgi:type I restriction enzyme, S subunit
LIENNARRIEVLDEVALRTYREWFVELRYPGHDGVEIVTSELGQIPSGWEVISIGSNFTVVLGGTPSRKRPEYWTNGTVPWINSGRVNDRRVIEPTELITETALRSSNAELMPRRTTVVAITGATLGQVSYLEIDASANQSVVGITDTSGADCEWLFLTVKTGVDRLVGAASGGAQQHINKSVVSEFRLVLPDSDVRKRFASVTRPMFDCIANLLKTNRELRAMRDLLLPRLMAGHIEVDDLDIAGEEIAA